MGPKYALPLHVGRPASTEVCIEVCMGPKYVWTEVYTYMYFGTEVWDRSMPCLYMWDALPPKKKSQQDTGRQQSIWTLARPTTLSLGLLYNVVYFVLWSTLYCGLPYTVVYFILWSTL